MKSELFDPSGNRTTGFVGYRPDLLDYYGFMTRERDLPHRYVSACHYPRRIDKDANCYAPVVFIRNHLGHWHWCWCQCSSLLILSLMIVAACTANLASDLTVKKANGLISGFDDIKGGKLSNGSRNFYPLLTMFEQSWCESLSDGDSRACECIRNSFFRIIFWSPMLPQSWRNEAIADSSCALFEPTSSYSGTRWDKRWNMVDQQHSAQFVIDVKEVFINDFLMKKMSHPESDGKVSSVDSILSP